ncbi:MAG: hypothetical protein N3F63_02120 [Thermoplasmata archaeon]|nr:hypothetical protein [Thermoplasmata archaeon]
MAAIPPVEKARHERMEFVHMEQKYLLRHALEEDWEQIRNLYTPEDMGSFSVPEAANRTAFLTTISSQNYFWAVCINMGNGKMEGSTIVQIDHENRIGRIIGLVVDNDALIGIVIYKLTEFARIALTERENILDSFYMELRTCIPGVDFEHQDLATKIFGIYPNLKKVSDYETLLLLVFFSPSVKERRYPGIKALPPEVRQLYSAAASNLHLPDVPEVAESGFIPAVAEEKQPQKIGFEPITAKMFIQRRFAQRKKTGATNVRYFSFFEPDLLLISDDGTTEVFVYFNRESRYCMLIAENMKRNIYERYLEEVCNTMLVLGARYVEIMLPADDTELLFRALRARFIPSAYYPCMHPENGFLKDYVVFSRTFEAFDFNKIRLTGKAKEYLEHYIKVWSKFYLANALPLIEEV